MVPDALDPRLKRVLTSENDLGKASLATRVLVSRLRREIKAHTVKMNDAISELCVFISKNPFAQSDLAHF